MTTCKKEEMKNSLTTNSIDDVKKETKEWYPKLGIKYSIKNYKSPNKCLIVPAKGDYNFNIANYLKGKIIFKYDIVKNKEADCNQLGPIRPKETVSQCIIRNYTNFPCDLEGATFIILFPKETFLACAIICGVSALMN